MTQLKFNPFSHKLDYTGVGGTGGGGIDSLTGNSGGNIGPDGSGNVNIVGGTGVSVAGNPSTNTLTISVASVFFTWQIITANQMAVAFNGYFTNGSPGGLQITLPATSAVGDTFEVVDRNGAGWKILQNAGQYIRYRTSQSTLGIGGSLGSQQEGDQATLVCSIANFEWIVVDTIATLTVV